MMKRRSTCLEYSNSIPSIPPLTFEDMKEVAPETYVVHGMNMVSVSIAWEIVENDSSSTYFKTEADADMYLKTTGSGKKLPMKINGAQVVTTAWCVKETYRRPVDVDPTKLWDKRETWTKSTFFVTSELADTYISQRVALGTLNTFAKTEVNFSNSFVK